MIKNNKIRTLMYWEEKFVIYDQAEPYLGNKQGKWKAISNGKVILITGIKQDTSTKNPWQMMRDK